jgi:tripartite-type tricarboxylate transporter receptor subunit TctC
MRGFLYILGVMCALAMSAASFSRAQTVEEFYRGKTISLVVGYPAGGGYDAYARPFAQNFGRHIPGSPNVIVTNMPGAASLTAMNYLFNVAPRDGTIIGMGARPVFMEPLYGSTLAKFDAQRFTWLGSLAQEVPLCFAWHTTALKEIQEARNREVIVGSTGQTSDSFIYPKILNAVLGTKFNVVVGYTDSAQIGLAMERGELDGACGFSYGTIKSARPDWLAKQEINLLLQLTIKKSPELPKVPLVTDYVTDSASRQLLNLAFGSTGLSRPLLAPPDIPSDRAETLRHAFDETVRDPEFLEEVRRGKLEIDPINGHSVAELLKSIYATPTDVVQKLITLRASLH